MREGVHVMDPVVRVTVNLVLAAAFCLLAAVIAMPLLAELRFNAAEKLIKEYRWKQADGEFRKAITLDPFNSKYPARLGGFLLAQAGYQGHKGPLIKEAGQLYRRALELDPRNAGCWLGLGLIELNNKAYEKAFIDFRKAAENDPNGFNIAYSIGSAGMGAWNKISEADKAFVIDRLRTAMMAMPSGDIYAMVWGARKDIGLLRAITPDSLAGQQWLYGFIVSRNLWQFRKEQAAKVDHYANSEDPKLFQSRKSVKMARIKEVRARYGSAPQGNGGRISAEDWRGMAPDGKNEYRNGNMYWTGTMDAVVYLPKGYAVISVRAKGSPAAGVYPYMIVELDGEEIGETFVDSADWKDYDFRINTSGGVKVLSVTFANDACTEKEDRNLYVGNAHIEAER